MVSQQRNTLTEIITSTWTLIILRNDDATTIPHSFLFIRVSLQPWTTVKSNFSQNPRKEPSQHPFALVNPKQPGAALLWAYICLKIVPNSHHSLHTDTKDNCGQHGQHKLVVWLHPKFTSRQRLQSMIFFMQITIVSVTVSASTQWHMLLLTWYEHDELLTWRWQDNRRTANGNLLFQGKASYSCSKRCLQSIYSLFPPPLPPCASSL